MTPNTTISEEELQHKLGSSRTPIREALQMLSKEGFVDIFPRKGIVVSPITLDLLKEIYETRLTLEPLITKRACGKIPDSFLLQIQSKLQNPPKNLNDAEAAAYYNEIDSAFHSTLIKCVQNRFFIDSMQLVSDHERRIRNITFNMQTNDEIVLQHLDVIDALLKRDEEQAEILARKHVEHAKRQAFFHILDL